MNRSGNAMRSALDEYENVDTNKLCFLQRQVRLLHENCARGEGGAQAGCEIGCVCVSALASVQATLVDRDKSNMLCWNRHKSRGTNESAENTRKMARHVSYARLRT